MKQIPKGKALNEQIYEIICKEWPIHASGICRYLKIKDSPSNISKIKYHFDILISKNKIRIKKIDRASVAWPTEIEKLRIMQELMGN